MNSFTLGCWSRAGSGVLLALSLSACGQSGATNNAGANATTGSGDQGAMPMAGATATMDHGMMPMATATAMMDHGAMQTSTAPFDAQFIDSMIEHHRGAIAMAEEALKQSERPEIKQLAQNIITSQRQEVDQMTAWRKEWYPNVQPTGGMGMAMGDMEVSADTSLPYDQRFITAMVAHHQGAITMAKEAQTKAEHQEIKQLADAIIKAQEAEVQQLQSWQQQWFGGGA